MTSVIQNRSVKTLWIWIHLSDRLPSISILSGMTLINNLVIRNHVIQIQRQSKRYVTIENHEIAVIWHSLAARECGTRLALREITSRHGKDALGWSTIVDGACLVTQHSRTRVSRSGDAKSATQPSKEGCNRGHMIPLAPGAARSSGLRIPDRAPQRSEITWKLVHFALGDPLAKVTYEGMCYHECWSRVTKGKLGMDSLSSTIMHWHVTLAKLQPVGRLSRALEDNHTILHSSLGCSHPLTWVSLLSRMKVCHLENWPRDRTSPQRHVARWRNAVPITDLRVANTLPSRSGVKKGRNERKWLLKVMKILTIRQRIHDTRILYTRIHDELKYTRVCIRIIMCMCVRARVCMNFSRSLNIHARGHGRHTSALGETLRPDPRSFLSPRFSVPRHPRVAQARTAFRISEGRATRTREGETARGSVIVGVGALGDCVGGGGGRGRLRTGCE